MAQKMGKMIKTEKFFYRLKMINYSVVMVSNFDLKNGMFGNISGNVPGSSNSITGENGKIQ